MPAPIPFSDWLGSDPEIAGLLGDELLRVARAVEKAKP